MSDETLDMLRRSRADIDKAARQSRAARPGATASHHRSRQHLPTADAAARTPEGAAQVRQAASDFYRNSAAARSVYRPDSLAGGMSDVGMGERPPPPMCGNGVDNGDAPPENLAQRFAQGGPMGVGVGMGSLLRLSLGWPRHQRVVLSCQLRLGHVLTQLFSGWRGCGRPSQVVAGST